MDNENISTTAVAQAEKRPKRKLKRWTTSEIEIFIYAMLGVVFLALFSYGPMYGIILAFKDGDGELNIARAISATGWVGFDNFAEFITDPDFTKVLINTLGLNIIQLILTFPAPILFAILLNEIKAKNFKRWVQIITFFPYFLSWVVFGGIFIGLLDYDSGILNYMITSMGGDPVDILGGAKYFWWLVIITALIKGVGWGSVIYIAAIGGINPEIYEAAQIDGANRWHKAIFITIPSITPTITLFLILSISGLLNSGFDQIWVFQNTNNLERSEVIDTFMYKYGIINSRYSYTTALGLFKSVVSVILLVLGNMASKFFTGKGII